MASKLFQAFTGALSHGLFAAFRVLPLDTASAAGGAFLRTLGPRLPVSNRARRNLRRAFPEKAPAEIEAIVRAMWDNIGRTTAEFAHLPEFDPYAGDGRVVVEGVENIELLRDDGKPGLFFACHLANWEVQIFALTRRGVPAAVTYRASNNPHVERLYHKARSGPFSGTWLAKGAKGARQIIDILRHGGHVAMLVDQKMNDGIPVPFFGRDAMTAPALAQLALKYRCPVVPCRIQRSGGARFRITFLPPLELPDTGDRAADVAALMRTVNAMIEDWVRDDPTQWLWLHRRWPD